MSFQVTLRAARVNRGMKQADAARSIGVSSARSINWEIGKRFPPGGQAAFPLRSLRCPHGQYFYTLEVRFN